MAAAKQADENGWVPLHLGALCANLDAVELLVSKDRSTAYVRDNEGRTALHFAAFDKDSSIMKKIIKYCPDCSEVLDERGSNALHYTTMGDKYYCFQLKRYLRDAPVIRNLYYEKDNEGNTPLHPLARHPPKKDHSCDHSLLKLKSPRVDTMACDKYGQTLLDIAVADVPPYTAYKSILITKLQNIGARLGGRVLNNHHREKKQEKRHDSVVEQKEDYLVAILIATVTFTAGFTLPGGLIQNGDKNQGSPILTSNFYFRMFVVTDSLSLVLSTSAVFALFLSSSEGEGDEKEWLLKISIIATLLALVFMVLAFGAGLGAVLGTSRGVGFAVTWAIVASFSIIYNIVVFKAMRVRKRTRKIRLQIVRDVQLSHTV